ncbi:MAG: hypothetical protein WCA55_05460 [Xanthobacteraceae bacterium]
MLLRTIAVAVALVASPALAFDTSKLGQGGSLALSEIDPIIAKSPQLQREINQALLDGKKAKDDVICSGMRFLGQWQTLGGLRVGPYTCDFGTKWLQVKTKAQLTGRKGKVFEGVTPAAMKTADKITETSPTWKWTTDDPSGEK